MEQKAKPKTDIHYAHDENLNKERLMNMAYGAILGKEPPEVTLESIGAAPAGYGLGSDMGLGVADCNAAIVSGWYYTGGSTINSPVVNGVTINYFCLLVSTRAAAVDQIAFTHQSGCHNIWTRYSLDSGATWTEWKCLTYEYGTTDKTAGSSPMPNGQLYFVYE